jgi:hypothetical protein
VSLCAVAQTPILERTISLSLEAEPLAHALEKIGTQAGFSFSYSPAVITAPARVTVQARNKTVRDVLNQIFQGTVHYKARTNHLILTRASVPVPKATTAIVIQGYVVQRGTDQKIEQASVYDKTSLSAATTDVYGFFRLKVDKEADTLRLFVSKEGYADTVWTFVEAKNQFVTMSLTQRPTEPPAALPEQTPADTVAGWTAEDVDSVFRHETFMPYRQRAAIRNIRDTLYRDIQISLLPFLGSNERLSGNVINNYSINMLGGYSLGTRQIELGFFVNIDRGDVRWLQIAGFTNLVGGHVNGFQGAGLANINGAGATAVQMAGASNINLGPANGVQVAGFVNLNTRQADGALVAGFANVANGPSQGVQVAGFVNVHAQRYTGSQVAGFGNVATDTLWGSQIAGVINIGKHVNGTQLGLINISKRLTGVPVGLISIVGNGYHQLELSADEVFYANLAFRTGVRQFYNILTAGLQPQSLADTASVWTVGYGVGTARRAARWLHVNVDVTAQHISQGKFTEALSLLNKVHVGLDWRLARKFSIYTGLTLNGYLTRSSPDDYPRLFYDYEPPIIRQQAVGRNSLQLWWGGKVALRFL